MSFGKNGFSGGKIAVSFCGIIPCGIKIIVVPVIHLCHIPRMAAAVS